MDNKEKLYSYSHSGTRSNMIFSPIYISQRKISTNIYVEIRNPRKYVRIVTKSLVPSHIVRHKTTVKRYRPVNHPIDMTQLRDSYFHSNSYKSNSQMDTRGYFDDRFRCWNNWSKNLNPFHNYAPKSPEYMQTVVSRWYIYSLFTSL